MRATLRGASSLGPLVALSVACGGSPQPIQGHAYWQDGCEMDSPGGSCLSANHTVSGDMGSSQVIMDCNIGPASGGGSQIILNIASGQGSFDQSSEGIAINGTVRAAGMEMDSGTLQVQGNGWQVPATGIGPSTMCHVYVDALSGTGVTGRIRCDEVSDTEVPARLRYVHGVPSFTASPDFGEFVVANCNSLAL